jgi:hypothetical protein
MLTELFRSLILTKCLERFERSDIQLNCHSGLMRSTTVRLQRVNHMFRNADPRGRFRVQPYYCLVISVSSKLRVISYFSARALEDPSIIQVNRPVYRPGARPVYVSRQKARAGPKTLPARPGT